MVNESDLPQFSKGYETPIGQVPNPNGLPVATKKQAGGLLKHIMANVKKLPKVKAVGKGRKSSIGKPGRRGIEGDSKVHFGHRKVKFY